MIKNSQSLDNHLLLSYVKNVQLYLGEQSEGPLVWFFNKHW